jgi:hypothetical protein
MSKLSRDHPHRVVVALILILLAVIFVPSGSTRAWSSLRAQKRMVQAVDRVFREGVHAQLPPHLSTLLGISVEKECAVMQGVVRTEQEVQGFDVSTANENDVVLFVVIKRTNEQTFYLTSAEGALRRVVSIEAGVGKVQRITTVDRRAFEKEKQFWLDRLAPVGSRK